MTHKTPSQLREKAAEFLVKAEVYEAKMRSASDACAWSSMAKHAAKVMEYRNKSVALVMQARYIEEAPKRIEKKEAQKRTAGANSKKRKEMTDEEALFIGVFPTGLSYADRRVEEHGDYKKLGFIRWDLSYEIYEGCPTPMRILILKDIKRLIAMRGQEYQTTASGQTVTLG